MQKIKSVILTLFLLSNIYSTNKIYINNQQNFDIHSIDEYTLEIHVSISEIDINEIMMEDDVYTNITIPGSFPSTKIGYPNLPMLNKLIEIPKEADVRIEIIQDDKSYYNGETYNINSLIIPSGFSGSYSSSRLSPTSSSKLSSVVAIIAVPISLPICEKTSVTCDAVVSLLTFFEFLFFCFVFVSLLFFFVVVFFFLFFFFFDFDGFSLKFSFSCATTLEVELENTLLLLFLVGFNGWIYLHLFPNLHAVPDQANLHF